MIINDILRDIELPKRESLGNIIIGLADKCGLTNESGIYDVLGNVFNDESKHDIYTNIGELTVAAARINVGSGNNNHTLINTYPFGFQSDSYPNFFGICVGKQYTFDSLLKEIQRHAKETQHRWPEMKKFSLIVTDKWDGSLFAANELDFWKYSLLDNRLFIFILVTNYGVEIIPLYAMNFRDIDDIRRNNPWIINELQR